MANTTEPPASQTLTLTDFLLARIAEDEAAGTAGEGWNVDGCDDVPVQFWDYGETHVGYRRFLAECEAKRRIAEEHSESVWQRPPFDEPTGKCETCGGMDNPVDFPCPTLRLLAIPYADHPDYREEWRP